MKKTIELVKKYKYPILLIIVYLLFFIQMQNVQMYADDYNIVALLRRSNNLLEYLYIFYFKNWSGRLIGHAVVTSGLYLFGIQFFRILNPLFLFLFCFYVAKIINIKKQYNTLQITFFITLTILGLNISMLNELLYWADGTILYLWAYIPMLLIIYFILDYYINNKHYSILRFILSLLFFTIINFTMESTTVLIVVFLFMININNVLKKDINKKMLILFAFSLIMLASSYFIPGNLNRLSKQETFFFEANIIEKFIIKLPDYFGYLFSSSFTPILFIVSFILAYYLLQTKNKINKIASIYLIIINSIIFINMSIYHFIDFNHLSLIMYIMFFIYLFINIYACLGVKTHNKELGYLLLGGIIANLTSIVLIEYTAYRFFFPLLVVFLIYIYYSYYNGDNKLKMFILLIFCLCVHWILGLTMFIALIIINKFCNNQMSYLKYSLIGILILFNIFNFSKCIYYYYENSKIFDYNLDIINNTDRTFAIDIYLKKLKYSQYAFHMPEEFSYVEPWYLEYYNLEKQTVKWVD